MTRKTTTPKRLDKQDAEIIEALQQQLGHKSFAVTVGFLLDIVRASNPSLLPVPGPLPEVPGQLPLITPAAPKLAGDTQPQPPVTTASSSIELDDDW